MKGDKLEDRIKAAQLIVECGTCRGVLEVCCMASRVPKWMVPCPNRKGEEPGWVCFGKDMLDADRHRVASARAFLDRHASPVVPDRETVQGPRFDTTREKSKEGKE